MTDRRFNFSNARVKTPWFEGPETAEVRTPETYVVVSPVLDLLDQPGGARERQLLFNDVVDVLDITDGFAFVRSSVTGYVGYVLADALRPKPQTPVPDLWVLSRMTHAYAEPDIKSPECMVLSMGTQLSNLGEENDLLKTEAGWVTGRHVTSGTQSDPVAIAERLIGTPYLWGGNSASGIDCSGLVWTAFAMCGVVLRPDSDLQNAHDGAVIDDGSVRRGDLWFWAGHVAMVVDAKHIIHANAHHMAVVVEDADKALVRIGATISRKRISLPHE